MTLTVDIPDDLAIQLTKGGGDLSRRALEALAAEEYKRERLNKPELQRLLGIETSFQLDEFLKAGGSAKCLTLRLDGEEAAVWRAG